MLSAPVAAAAALPLAGPRVTVRRLRAADLAQFQAYRHDPEVGRWQGWQPRADADALAFLQAMAVAPAFAPGEWLQLGIALLGRDGEGDCAGAGVGDRDGDGDEDGAGRGDALVGDIGLHTADDGASVEIGFTLAAPAQGRGLAAEAVGLALHWVWTHSAAARVVAITDARNTACVRLLQRLHFAQLQTLDAVFRGAPCREHHFQQQRPAQP